MGRLGHDEAVRAIESSTNVAELASAIASLTDDPSTRPEELLPALDHHEFVAEQAAIALHRMTKTPWPRAGQPIVSRRGWEKRLEAKGIRVLWAPVQDKQRKVDELKAELDRLRGQIEKVDRRLEILLKRSGRRGRSSSRKRIGKSRIVTPLR